MGMVQKFRNSGNTHATARLVPMALSFVFSFSSRVLGEQAFSGLASFFGSVVVGFFFRA